MASIALSQRTLDEIGVDRDVLAYYFFPGEADPITLQFAVNNVPIDITNYTFEFSLTEQSYDRAGDTKNGYEIRGLRDKEGSILVDYSDQVTITDAVNGLALFYIPSEVTATGSTDPDYPVVYFGYFTFRDHASVGELIQDTPVVIVVK